MAKNTENVDQAKLFTLFGENQSHILKITFVYQRQINLFILLQNLFNLLLETLQEECEKLDNHLKRNGKKKLFHCAQRDFAELILLKRIREIRPPRRMVPGNRMTLSCYIANASASEFYCLNLLLVLENRKVDRRNSFKLPPMHCCYYVCDYNVLIQLYLNPAQTLATNSSDYWEEMRQRLSSFCNSRDTTTCTLCSIRIELPEAPDRFSADVKSLINDCERLTMDSMRYVPMFE